MVNISSEDVTLEKFLKNFTYTGSGDAGKTELPLAIFFETASLLRIAENLWRLK